MAVGGSFSFRAGVRALLLVPFVALALNGARAAEPAVVIPAPALDATAPPSGWYADRSFGRRLLLGCAGVFSSIPKGVTPAVSGYAGGEKANGAL